MGQVLKQICGPKETELIRTAMNFSEKYWGTQNYNEICTLLLASDTESMLYALNEVLGEELVTYLINHTIGNSYNLYLLARTIHAWI